MPNLRKLHLGATPINGTGLAAFAGSKLESLQLDKTAVIDGGVKAAAGIRSLKALVLHQCSNFSDPGVAALAGHPNLTALYLSGTVVTDTGLKAVARIPGLRRLVPGHFTTDAGLKDLEALKGLEELTLTHTPKVTARGVADFKAAVPGCRVTSPFTDGKADRAAADWVFSKGGKIQDMARGWLEDPKQLGTHIILTHVHIPGTYRATDADLARFADLVALEYLDFGKSDITDDGVLALTRFANAPRMTHLGLNSPAVGDEGVARLPAAFPALTYLSLAHSKLTAAGLPALRKLPALRELNLSLTGVTNVGLNQLKELSLQTLWLKGNFRLGDAGMPALATLADLERLQLEGVPITGLGLAALTPLKKLKGLEVQSGSTFTPADLALLAGFPDLEALSLPGSTGNAGLASLAGVRRLKSLTVHGDSVTDAGLKHLRGLPLEYLTLYSGKITDAAVPDLTAIKALRELNLIRPGLTPAGEASLRAALPGCKVSVSCY
jgi:hypothetical protein